MLSIALCTYNGEQYLKEQLESFANQSLLPDELVVCDDGSSDGTIEILQMFSLCAPFEVKVIQNEKSLGIVKNFSKAIEYCSGEYIAISDQDDIWMYEKLKETVGLLKVMEKKYGKEFPLLVHSDLTVVDVDLNILNESMMKSQHIENEDIPSRALGTLLANNYVTGCTVVINKALKNLSLPIPREAIMHDRWLALVAASSGKIGFVDQPLILYRQHGNNQVGARKYFSYNNVKKFFKSSSMSEHILKTILQNKQIWEKYQNPYIGKYIFFLRKKDLFSLWKMGVRMQGIIRNIGYYYYLFRMRKEIASIL